MVLQQISRNRKARYILVVESWQLKLQSALIPIASVHLLSVPAYSCPGVLYNNAVLIVHSIKVKIITEHNLTRQETQTSNDLGMYCRTHKHQNSHVAFISTIPAYIGGFYFTERN